MHGVNEFKEDEEKVFKYAMKIKCNKCQVLESKVVRKITCFGIKSMHE